VPLSARGALGSLGNRLPARDPQPTLIRFALICPTASQGGCVHLIAQNRLRFIVCFVCKDVLGSRQQGQNPANFHAIAPPPGTIPRARSLRRFCDILEVLLTWGRVDHRSTPGLPHGRYTKSGTPHLKPVIGVYLMQNPGNRRWRLKDDTFPPPWQIPQVNPQVTRGFNPLFRTKRSASGLRQSSAH
jgi:hypothetical protein